MTKSMKDALKWLSEHNADGLFDRNGVLVAGGEKGPFTRATWNRLAAGGFIEFYKAGGKATRVRIKNVEA